MDVLGIHFLSLTPKTAVEAVVIPTSSPAASGVRFAVFCKAHDSQASAVEAGVISYLISFTEIYL